MLSRDYSLEPSLECFIPGRLQTVFPSSNWFLTSDTNRHNISIHSSGLKRKATPLAGKWDLNIERRCVKLSSHCCCFFRNLIHVSSHEVLIFERRNTKDSGLEYNSYVCYAIISWISTGISSVSKVHTKDKTMETHLAQTRKWINELIN